MGFCSSGTFALISVDPQTAGWVIHVALGVLTLKTHFSEF